MDLGHGVTATYTSWRPDRDLNPRYRDLPDVAHWGLIVTHPRPDGGGECVSGIDFDTSVRQRMIDGGLLPPGRPSWTVVQDEPLTLSPSLLCTACGHHGFIQDGRWVPA
jgi:hypothetical protein